MKNKDNDSVKGGCYLILIIFNTIVGGWSVSYLLEIFANKIIPFWGSCLIGLFTAQVSVPVAIVVWLLKFFGVL
jgi:hypothetical protein